MQTQHWLVFGWVKGQRSRTRTGLTDVQKVGELLLKSASEISLKPEAKYKAVRGGSRLLHSMVAGCFNKDKMKMADLAGGGADIAPTFKWSRLKPEILYIKQLMGG